MLPCVDAPGHKSKWSATVTAPAWATVLMSAIEEGKPTTTGKVWRMTNGQPGGGREGGLVDTGTFFFSFFLFPPC